MQRIRFGRISAAVSALCLAGAIQHSDDIYAMVNATEDDGDVVPGAVQISMDAFGVVTGATLPFAGGHSASLDRLKCTTDVPLQRRVCSSRRPSDSTFSASVTTHRSSTGVTQLAFDGLTTDTIVSQMATVRRNTDRDGHATDLMQRGTRRWSGVAYASATMTLNGADTTYAAVHRASGLTRFTGIVAYSDVRLTRHPSQFARDYPTSGIMYATSTNERATPVQMRPSYANVIVYFDGTRSPDAYVDGKPFRLDLQTGVATPRSSTQ